MEQKFNHLQILCSVHPTEIITKIDPTLSLQKSLYCSDCILEAEDPKLLAKVLITFDKFLESAEAANISKLKESPDALPEEYMKVLDKEDERLSKLTAHINQEKDKVSVIFDKIAGIVLRTVDSIRKKHLQKLEGEISEACKQALTFKRQLKRNYPRQEDLNDLFPTKDQLKSRLASINSALELQKFVENIKYDMELDNEIHRVVTTDEAGSKRREYFDGLISALNKIETSKPIFEVNDSYLTHLEDKLTPVLEEQIQNILLLKNSISNNTLLGYDFGSSIITPKDFQQIRAWIPSQYEFAPKLLYSSKKDGVASETFHSKCDGKGPTITIIKFQVPNSNKVSIVGGFSDVSWNQSRGYSYSTEAFIFSLTKNVKCQVKNPDRAIYGDRQYAATFGDGFDLFVSDGLIKSQVHPGYAYWNAERLIEAEDYKSGYFYFDAQEVEVYALK